MSENPDKWVSDLNCDGLIGKICQYKIPTGVVTARRQPFLIVSRSTQPRDYPVYSVLFSDGHMLECAAFGNQEIEEVKVETP